MSNFAFAQDLLPAVHADAARAESYLTSDPRTACIYSRRAAELLVGYLYDVLGLSEPYRADLAARTNAPVFKAETGNGINQKLNLIRERGNDAVHGKAAITGRTALITLRELHHVLIWAAFHYTAHPGAVPVHAEFDPALAASAAPLSREEVVELAQRFAEQDEAHAQELAQKDELLAARDAELEHLRAQIEAAQAAKTVPYHRDQDEATTRHHLIDDYLGEAGWLLTEDRDREYPVTGMPTTSGRGYVDYVLWGADGLPLAVVEAKRASTSAAVGQQQAERYADALQAQFGRRPVIFYTNGQDHWLWDDAAGYPPRQVQGFYTRDELELLIARRDAREPLSQAPVDSAIAGRPYQVRAIKSVGDALDSKERAALLVMATGSGKTRTAVALVKQLMEAGWVKRVLFLADRTELVRQAGGAFREHLRDVPRVNLVTNPQGSGRVYLSTYPTMLNRMNEREQVGETEQFRFGVGFFDLIIIDEAHRSVFAKYGAIFDRFDAMRLGLTATPKDEVDRSTYRLFNLEAGVPTDAYSLQEAVGDGYLVPPKGVSVGTTFLRQGIQYADLSETEQDQWDALDWGEAHAPDEVGAEELNRFLFNSDTVDKVLRTLMTEGHTVAGGDRLGKSIIFAKNQHHADFIAERFDATWPEHAGGFARVITHATPYAGRMIDDFRRPSKAPHIAISVDMLDTGIDIPEIVNLVFFKTVRSPSKFWQMIGRGTRLRPDLFGPGQDKTDFLVFDFCGNLEHFNTELPPAKGSVRRSLTERSFAARVGLLQALDATAAAPDLRTSIARALREHVAGMDLRNVLVRPHRHAVERFSQAGAWERVTATDAETLAPLGGLPSAAQDQDEDAKRFDLLILRRQMADVEADRVAADQFRELIQATAEALLAKTSIPDVAAQAQLLEDVAGDGWWVDVTLPMLETARVRLRPLVRHIDRKGKNPVYTDILDEMHEATEVDLQGVTPGLDVERFRAKAAAYLRDHADHVAMQRLRRNRQLTEADLDSLEQMLLDSGIARPADLDAAAEETGGLGLFIRSLVGLDRQAATEAFAEYLDETQFSLNQVRFAGLIVEELTANGVMEPGRLYESPYTDHGRADLMFSGTQVDTIVQTLRDIRATAIPSEVA